jgi:hypothetical protein
MPGSQPFASWNIFDSALIKNANGHHYWETKGLVDELVRRGENVRLFSHRFVPTTEEFPGILITPVFSLFLYQSISDDSTWSTLENFIMHNRTFSLELSRLDPAQFQNSIVVFPTVGERQLLGIFRWLGTFPEAAAPKAAICLLPPFEWSNSDHRTGLYKTVWHDCPPEVRNRVALYGRTSQIADMFIKYTGMPARVFPYPIPEDLAAIQTNSGIAPPGPMMVSFVGGARRERGGELIADVVRQCRGLDIRFFIQVRKGSDTDMDTQVLTDLAGLPHVQLHEGSLQRGDYCRAIADSVVLLAYDPAEYRWRDSGVYHEARFLDAPVLVTAGSFMADEVMRSGNGLVIEDFSVPAIVDSIVRAQRELPALRDAAARIGRDVREQHGVGRCLDALAAPFSSSGVD